MMDDLTALPDSLQQLLSACALQFGCRLLDRGCEDDLDYGTLVAAARDMVDDSPQQAAMFLAGLVAQDMLRVAAMARPTPEPGLN